MPDSSCVELKRGRGLDSRLEAHSGRVGSLEHGAAVADRREMEPSRSDDAHERGGALLGEGALAHAILALRPLLWHLVHPLVVG
eukprot:6403975-Prymnesium_polylepis.1